ncbi:MAG: hypothetical protein EOP85_17835, partial [Verrucomicrobiaceae bacterium]
MKPRTNLFAKNPSSQILPYLTLLFVGATLPGLKAADNIWTGTLSTDWNAPENWSLGRVPAKTTFNDEAVINTNTGSVATISADLAAGPAGIIVGLPHQMGKLIDSIKVTPTLAFGA